MKVGRKGAGGGQEDGEVLRERWGKTGGWGGEEDKSMNDSSAAFSIQVGCNDKRILVP